MLDYGCGIGRHFVFYQHGCLVDKAQIVGFDPTSDLLNWQLTRLLKSG